MDWSLLQQVLSSAATVAIGVAVPVGIAVFTHYTGISVSTQNEASIRAAATTEAGKLITMGTPVTPATVAAGASKVLSDLAPQIKAEGYTHDDVKDMIIGAAATVAPPVVGSLLR
jgi:hypothetical protein